MTFLLFSVPVETIATLSVPLLSVAELFWGGWGGGEYTFFGCWLLFWCWYVAFLPLLYLPIWFVVGLYDTLWLGFASRALLVLLIWVILLFRSSPKSSSDPTRKIFGNCLIRLGNLGLIMSLLNWLVSHATCLRKEKLGHISTVWEVPCLGPLSIYPSFLSLYHKFLWLHMQHWHVTNEFCDNLCQSYDLQSGGFHLL